MTRLKERQRQEFTSISSTLIQRNVRANLKTRAPGAGHQACCLVTSDLVANFLIRQDFSCLKALYYFGD